MKRVALILLAALAGTASAQSIYKCPSPTPGAPPTIQQMPCSPTGGGETMTVKPIPAGAGSGISESAKSYSQELTDRRAEQARLDNEENKRQEALRVERDKARSAEDQARATWYLGTMTGLRR